MENMENKVLDYFGEIAKIPHGSGNREGIVKYLVQFAEDHGLWYKVDASDNVIMKKPAAAGYEDADPVIIQGHTDMVCEKTADCSKDMAAEGLDLKTDGDWLYAEGTTLGGDDGIAVAMALAVLDMDGLGHPALECIFTSDEEIGMIGARHLDISDISAKKMINIDSEDEGVFVVSCAGGGNAEIRLPVETGAEDADGFIVMDIVIDGLIGGHSGIMIDRERANSNVLMGRLLAELSKEYDIRLVSMDGGKVGNVICKKTDAKIVVNAGEAAQIKEAAHEFGEILKHEFEATDPEIKITVSEYSETAGAVSAMTDESTERILTWLVTAPNGIQNMSAVGLGEVESSLNIGAVKTEEDCVRFIYTVRSVSASRKELLKDKLWNLAGLLGGSFSFEGDYPGWEYLQNSALRDTAVKVFTEQYNHGPRIVSTHAGLECGIFAGKIGAGFDAISIGPDNPDVHTPDEKVSISSVERTFRLLCGILKESK